jgi:hypothetical protein
MQSVYNWLVCCAKLDSTTYQLQCYVIYPACATTWRHCRVELAVCDPSGPKHVADWLNQLWYQPQWAHFALMAWCLRRRTRCGHAHTFLLRKRMLFSTWSRVTSYTPNTSHALLSTASVFLLVLVIPQYNSSNSTGNITGMISQVRALMQCLSLACHYAIVVLCSLYVMPISGRHRSVTILPPRTLASCGLFRT